MKAFIVMAALLASPAWAQERRQAPISDTEDSSLHSVDIGQGRLHTLFDIDVRNGDFARGIYDDDGANLDRVPVHAQIGVIYELVRGADGEARSWLMARSSNGFHAPARDERVDPRFWYESNDLIGVATRLDPGLIGALTYTVKASPNDVSDTTHELSTALSLDRSGGLGALKPGLVATVRPKGGSGLYTQATIDPGWRLGEASDAPRLSFPAVLGVGWNGFYQRDSSNRIYGSVGLAIRKPLAIGGHYWSVHAEAQALVRDGRLRTLGGPEADHSAVVPYVTIGLSYAR